MMRNTSVSGGSASYALAGAKDARLEIRTSLEIKEKLREAASLVGVDMSSFILMAAMKAAQHELYNQRLRILSEYEWEHLNYVLNNPRPAGDKLRKLMTRKTKYEKQY